MKSASAAAVVKSPSSSAATILSYVEMLCSLGLPLRIRRPRRFENVIGSSSASSSCEMRSCSRPRNSSALPLASMVHLRYRFRKRLQCRYIPVADWASKCVQGTADRRLGGVAEQGTLEGEGR